MLLPREQEPGAPWRKYAWGGGVLLGVVALCVLVFSGRMPSRMESLREEALDPPYEALKPLHEPKRPPQPGEWLDRFPEPGQSLAEYKTTFHVHPRPGQRTIYLQLLGGFTREQHRVITLTAEYIERFFGLPVRLLEPLPSSAIPAKARRNHPSTGQPQLLTTYVLYELLAPNRPADAVVFVAFTAEDLWPGQGWSYVFGEASMFDRVGVWSIHRNGNPSLSDESFRLCLRRTLGTAVHELSHLFSLPHCIAYECLMNGSNSMEESDSQPSVLCPSCLNKLCWNLGCEPLERQRRLLEFATREHLTEDLPALQRTLHALDGARH
jgi:archaemetzincin